MRRSYKAKFFIDTLLNNFLTDCVVQRSLDSLILQGGSPRVRGWMLTVCLFLHARLKTTRQGSTRKINQRFQLNVTVVYTWLQHDVQIGDQAALADIHSSGRSRDSFFVEVEYSSMWAM